MRRDDELVGLERPQRVLDRLYGVAVTDLAGRLDARAPHGLQARVESVLCLLTGLVLVGGPMAKGRVERRADPEHARRAIGHAWTDPLGELRAGRRLVPRRPPAVLLRG